MLFRVTPLHYRLNSDYTLKYPWKPPIQKFTFKWPNVGPPQPLKLMTKSDTLCLMMAVQHKIKLSHCWNQRTQTKLDGKLKCSDSLTKRKCSNFSPKYSQCWWRFLSPTCVTNNNLRSWFLSLRPIVEHLKRKFGFTVISRLVTAVNIIARLSVQMMPVSVVMFSPTLSNLDLLVVSQKRQQVDPVHINQTFWRLDQWEAPNIMMKSAKVKKNISRIF